MQFIFANTSHSEDCAGKLGCQDYECEQFLFIHLSAGAHSGTPDLVDRSHSVMIRFIRSRVISATGMLPKLANINILFTKSLHKNVSMQRAFQSSLSLCIPVVSGPVEYHISTRLANRTEPSANSRNEELAEQSRLRVSSERVVRSMLFWWKFGVLMANLFCKTETPITSVYSAESEGCTATASSHLDFDPTSFLYGPPGTLLLVLLPTCILLATTVSTRFPWLLITYSLYRPPSSIP
jgi:hypothetical protein